MLDPSLRATTVAGLLQPHSFTKEPTQKEIPIQDLPDTSILFHRYLDSGKTINVFDLFESFKVVLESQRVLSKNTGKAKRKAKIDDDDEWRIKVQARFIRAFHELDHLGFIKHTGRKTEHITRTLFDPTD
jgi:origin recognition complex subunit 3